MMYKLIRYELNTDGTTLQFPELSARADLEFVYATRDRLQAASIRRGVSMTRKRWGIWPC